MIPAPTLALIETAFAPYHCVCQPENSHYALRVSDVDGTLLYQDTLPEARLSSLRRTAQVILEVRQWLATRHSGPRTYPAAAA